jgi:hypothetical protein
MITRFFPRGDPEIRDAVADPIVRKKTVNIRDNGVFAMIEPVRPKASGPDAFPLGERRKMRVGTFKKFRAWFHILSLNKWYNGCTINTGIYQMSDV